jgi:putative hydrolase of HD superfamily
MKIKDFIEFAKNVGKLKKIPRTGWKIRGVKNPESIADHTFRTTVLGMIIADLEKLNKEKILKMIILHDLEESITGDITSLDKEKMGEKIRKIGEDAMKSVLSKLPSEIKKEYFNLWKEMEEGNTSEAKLCKDIDILEMMIQALEYEREQPNRKKDLEIFWKREKNRVEHPLLREIFEELKRERENK